MAGKGLQPAPVRILPRVVMSVAGLVLFAAAWFAIAGRLDWVQGWALLGLFLAYVAALVWRVSRADPDLFRERNQPEEVAEGWDRALMRGYTLLLVVLLFLAALDGGRYHWSAVPLWAQALGWALLGVAGAIVWHVMTVNAYLSSWARIQEDRGQVVVREGLYGRVRHPMYLGIILAFGGLPLALGSWWALVPGAAIAALFTYRTAREDRMLREKLPGYEAYAQEVRYRLVPGVW